VLFDELHNSAMVTIDEAVGTQILVLDDNLPGSHEPSDRFSTETTAFRPNLIVLPHR
jgi:hypothetical protein